VYKQRGWCVFKQHALVTARSFLSWFGRSPQSDVKASAEVRVAEREDAESQLEWGTECPARPVEPLPDLPAV